MQLQNPPPCFIVAYWHSLTGCSPALQRKNCLLRYSNISSLTLQARAAAATSVSPWFHAWEICLFLFLHWRCGCLAATLPWRPLLALRLWSVDEYTQFPPVSTSSELMLDNVRFQGEVSRISSVALSFLGSSLRLQSALLVSLCFFRSASHLDTPVYSETFVWHRPCWCTLSTLCLVAVLSFAVVYSQWHETVSHNFTSAAVWLFISQYSASYTAVFLPIHDCVSSFIWITWSLASTWYNWLR